jgi:GNAT superfamily N-acetyltransferase
MGRHGWCAREVGTLWICELDGAPPPVTPRAAAGFQELEADRVEQLAAVMGSGQTRHVYERLRSGRRCFIAVIDGAIASYAWVSIRCEWMGELERVLLLPEGECYIWDCATVPAHRRQRLYAALLGHILTALRGEGVRRAWIGASQANHPSTQGIVIAGFRPAVHTGYLRLWQICCLRLSVPDSAAPALAADVFRLIARRGERRVGSVLIGFGGSAARWCTSPPRSPASPLPLS